MSRAPYGCGTPNRTTPRESAVHNRPVGRSGEATKRAPGVGCRGGVSGRFGLYLSPSAIVGLIVRIGVTAEVTGGDGTSDINAATFFRNVVVR